MRPHHLIPALLFATLFTTPALAQSIIPAADGTGTLVLPDGSTYQITGGTLSGDGANLFHSFEQFGLTAAEVANFLADPTVQNILGRVVGGNASVINGLMQVSGSSANLYLLNPAGILFGPNSALNLEGSFTATTASGVGFGENWLQAIGDTTYAALTGNPTGFAFGGEPGALINLGNLAVNPGEVITLASGAVINLGTLNAPGGQIIVLAVPGENRVSIRPEGAILSLELATLPEGEISTAPLPFSPLDIPSLLRAGEPEVATGIAVNSDGTVSLAGASATLPTTPGTALVSGTLDGTGETGGVVQVLGDRIAVTAATIDASGTQGGGQILIGGEYQGRGTTPTADRTYVDASSTLRADAGESGDGGEVIVWADQGTRFDGTITARGGAAAGNGGFVEVSGRDTLAFNGRVDVSAAQGDFGTLLLDPTNITISAAPSSPDPDVNNSLPDIFEAELLGDIVINNTVLSNQTANVVLQATNDITVSDPIAITTQSVGITAQAATITLNNSISTTGGNITLDGDINTPTGEINLSTGGTGTVILTDPVTANLSFSNSAVIRFEQGVTGGSISIFGAPTLEIGGNYLGNHNFGGLSISLIGNTLFGGEGSTSIVFGAPINLNGNALSIQSSAVQVSDLTGTPGSSIALTGTVTTTGDRVFTADEIDFNGTVAGTGSLTLQPASANQSISLGGTTDSGPTILDLQATDLTALQNGFSSITVGSTTGTGDITLAGNVTFSDPTTLQTLGSIDTTGGTLSGTDNASLSLEAGAGVITGAISTQGQPVVITGDRDGNGEGNVTVDQSITTGGGDITIAGSSSSGVGVQIVNTLGSSGGSISVTGNSTGTDPVLGRGIYALGATINSQGGDITLTGTSTNAEGMFILSSSISSQGGAITAIGSSTSTLDSVFDQGLDIRASTLTSQGGAITLTGDSVNAEGIFNSAIISSNGGNIALMGTGVPVGISHSGSLDSGSGDIILATDIPLLSGEVNGTGGLVIQPLTPSLPLTLGGTDDPAITFLNQDEINQLGNGFSSRTIGQVGNTGPITLEPFTLASPLTIAGGVLAGPSQDTTFAIAPDGSLEIGGFGAPLRLLNPTEIVGDDSATNTVLGRAGNDTFTIVGDGTGLLGGIRFSGISVFDGGAGFDTVAGTGANNYFVVTGSSGGFSLSSDFLPDISFTNVERLVTGTGNDTVKLQGVPLELEVIGGDRLTILGSPDVTLNANVTTPGDLDIFAGTIAQTGGQVTVGGNTALFASGNIGLGGSNDFNTVTVGSGQNITLRDRNNLQLNDLVFSGGLQVTAAGNLTTANITTAGAPIDLQAGGALTTGNLYSSGSNGGAVSLQAGHIQVNSINAQGTINGGSITALTSGTFHALGSFVDQNGIAASLSTVGGSRGGAVSLGYGSSTFTLGDPSFNGTLGAITTGDVTLLPDVANPILGSRIFGRNLPGQVQFISFGDIPIEVEPPPDDIDPVPDPEHPLESLNEDSPVFLTNAGDILGQEQFSEAEDSANSDFAGYFGDLIKSPRSVNLAQAQATLRDIAAQTGELPALMYMRLNRSEKPGEGGVELLLITGEGDPTRVRVLNTTAEDVLKTQEQLRRQITNPSLTNNTAYLTSAQQLYGWLIAPIEAELKAAGITNIGFVLDAGLRTLPLAALHNGERFLIEDYSVGLIPSLGLIDPTYVALNRQNSTLLVSGASQFINQPPLLAAEVEMQTLQTLWPGTKVAETNFTVSNLQRDRRQAQIIHMATHAQFLRGAPNNSYLQFFDSRLRLNQVPELGWFDPQVELVTLSACQTAMGNTDAELGFAGFALMAGAKSALASLWKVSDEATAGLMTTFYQNLDQAAIKADALRDAQLAMIRGEVYTESGQLIWTGGALALPPDLVVDGRQDLSHPFYWAAFTMVGSPW